MSDPREETQEHYMWTAYLKLKGETLARREDDIRAEFDGFVQSLRGVGVDYKIIVMVEGRPPRQKRSEFRMKNIRVKIAREESGA